MFRHDGKLVSATGMPVAGFMDVALLRDESIVVNSGSYDRSNAGHALLQIDKTGTVVRRADEVTHVALKEWWMERGLSLGQKTGRLIVSHPNEFVIDVYDTKLERVMRLERQAAWFEGSSPDGRERSDGLFDVPPTSRVVRAWEDASGLIWMVVMVRAPEWEPRKPPAERITAESPIMTRPRYETVIEVIDPASKRVLVRERSRERTEFRDGYAWAVREAPDGTQRRVGWRLRLER